MGKLLDRFVALGSGVRLGISAGLLAVIAGGYFYWFYLPRKEELTQVQAKLAAAEAKLAESRRTARELPRFKEEVLRLNQELIVALAQLPEEKDIPDLLASVSRVGQDSGLEVLLFRPGAERAEGLYASIPVQMRATGSFHQLLTFFDRVSRLPRIVTIGDVALGEATEAAGRLILNSTFNATTYRFLPDAGTSAQKDRGKGQEKKSGR